MLLSPGQAGDNPMLIPLLGAHPDRLTGDKRLLADKAYSHNSTREELRSAASPWPRSSSTTASAISRHALADQPARK